MFGMLNVSVAAMMNLSKIDLSDKHQMSITMMLSSGLQCLLLGWSASSQRLHLAPQFALGCQENFVGTFFIL